MERQRLLLLLARLLWLATVPLALLLFIAGLLLKLQQGQEGAPEMHIRHGMALATWNSTLLDLLLLAGFAVLAGLLIWRRGHDWFAVLLSMAMILVPVRLPTEYTLLVAAYPSLHLIVGLVSVVGAGAIPVMLVLFPDGRFVPRQSWLYVIAGFIYAAVAYLLPAYAAIRFTPLGALIDALMVSIGIGAQVYRYRYAATPLQRQQCKWVLAGFSVGAAGFYVSELPLLLGARFWPALTESPQFELLPQLVANLALLMVPLSITLSILRYRLWDIDVLIRRTLVYSILTLSLAVIYGLIVIILQPTLLWFTGSQATQFVTALSTLAVAALFTPLRRRVQLAIDSRFYRRKVDAAKTLAAFGAIARNEVDLQTLQDALAQVVANAVQPARLSLWLTPPALSPVRDQPFGLTLPASISLTGAAQTAAAALLPPNENGGPPMPAPQELSIEGPPPVV